MAGQGNVKVKACMLSYSRDWAFPVLGVRRKVWSPILPPPPNSSVLFVKYDKYTRNKPSNIYTNTGLVYLFLSIH